MVSQLLRLVRLVRLLKLLRILRIGRLYDRLKESLNIRYGCVAAHALCDEACNRC